MTDNTKPQQSQQCNGSEGAYPHLTFPYVMARTDLGKSIERKFGDKLKQTFKTFEATTDEILGLKAAQIKTENLPDIIGAEYAAKNQDFGGKQVQMQYERQIETTMNLAKGQLENIKYAVNNSNGEDEQKIKNMLDEASKFLSVRLQNNSRSLADNEIKRMQTGQQSGSIDF